MRKFLIIDSYNESDRDDLKRYNIPHANESYMNVIRKYVTNISFSVIYGNHKDIVFPDRVDSFNGVLWTGSGDIPQVVIDKQKLFCEHCFKVGIPQYGSCWGFQIAVITSGGYTRPCPNGREQGLGRRIFVYEKDHPMYKNKPRIFDGFVSHNDEGVIVNDNVKVLASNSHCIQSIDVSMHEGHFWGSQYHPEYSLEDMANLLLLRKIKCNHLDANDIEDLSNILREINRTKNKSLAWKVGIYDDILDDEIRELELYNWLNHFN